MDGAFLSIEDVRAGDMVLCVTNPEAEQVLKLTIASSDLESDWNTIVCTPGTGSTRWIGNDGCLQVI